jgi:hypothetical protein
LIDPTQWKRAKWQATGFFSDEKSNDLPCLGFIFHNNRHGRNIFKQWHKQFGLVDSFEELRISIVQGLEAYEGIGYIIHLSSDPLHTTKRLKSQYLQQEAKQVAVESLLQSMNPLPKSPHLSNFRHKYEKRGEYAIVPFWRASQFSSDIRANFDLSILKKQIFFRRLEDIKEGDPDWAIFESAIL